ncbi:hypothetical protein ES703_116113 [subsurface metagenome]
MIYYGLKIAFKGSSRGIPINFTIHFIAVFEQKAFHGLCIVVTIIEVVFIVNVIRHPIHHCVAVVVDLETAGRQEQGPQNYSAATSIHPFSFLRTYSFHTTARPAEAETTRSLRKYQSIGRET